jgi:hypothetical protein
MAAKTYLQQFGGRLKQIAATVISTGAANAGDIVALTDAGVLDISLMPTGIGPNTWSGPATEAIGSGKVVNIYWSSGVASARLADASSAGKRAVGYAPTGVASGATVTVYFGGANSQVSGLTGPDVFLSASTPGGVTSTIPTGAGQVVQRLGVAASATSFMFRPEVDIELV